MSRLLIVMLLVNLINTLKVRDKELKTLDHILKAQDKNDYYSLLTDLLQYFAKLKKTTQESNVNQKSQEKVTNKILLFLEAYCLFVVCM